MSIRTGGRAFFQLHDLFPLGSDPTPLRVSTRNPWRLHPGDEKCLSVDPNRRARFFPTPQPISPGFRPHPTPGLHPEPVALTPRLQIWQTSDSEPTEMVRNPQKRHRNPPRNPCRNPRELGREVTKRSSKSTAINFLRNPAIIEAQQHLFPLRGTRPPLQAVYITI